MMQPPTTPTLRETCAAVLALAAAATERPWHDDGWDMFEDGGEWMRCITDAASDLLLEIPSGEYTVPEGTHQAVNDAAYIVHSANAAVPLAQAVLALLEVAEALRGLRKAGDDYGEAMDRCLAAVKHHETPDWDGWNAAGERFNAAEEIADAALAALAEAR